MLEIERDLLEIAAIIERVHDRVQQLFEPCTIEALRTARAREVLTGSVDTVIAAADAAIADVIAVSRIAHQERSR